MCDPSRHKPDGGRWDEGERHSVEVFGILGEPSATIDPGDGAAQLRAAKGVAGEDLLQEGKQSADPAVGHQQGAATVLDAGRMNHHIEDQAEGAGQEMTLLACIAPA